MAHSHPRHPQLSGKGLVIKDGCLLLVRGDGDGTYWALPGGRSDQGEDIKSCVRREVREETGLRVRVGRLFAAAEYFDPEISFHVMQMIFHCTVEEGALRGDWVDCGGTVAESRFFSHEDIQTLQTVYPTFLRDGTWRAVDESECLYKGMEIRII